MNFAVWSIRNPIPSVLLFTLLVMAGVFGFQNFRIQDLPDIDFPQIQITVSQSGATPAQLENEVARKVEDAISGIAGVKHITTAITNGSVMITVMFELETLISDALVETKDAVDRIRADLPADIETPVIAAVRFNGQPLMTFAVSSSRMDEMALSWFVDDKIGKAIKSIRGVGKFQRAGGVEREIRIEIDPIKLAARNATVADISDGIKKMQLEASGGSGDFGQSDQPIRLIATAGRAQDLEAMPVVLADGRHLLLGQVATIHDRHSTRKQLALLNGTEGVAFQVFGSKGADEVQIAEDVKHVVETLPEHYPGLTITPIVNTVSYTLEQYDGSMRMLFEGAILAVVVVGLFLRDWRATLISAAALPLSIIPTFGLMYFLGFSLNMLSLLAMAVVVGILIDDAIVEIENIIRHRQMGKPTTVATEDAVNEIALAVIATTLAIAAVFLPTALMGGIVGKLFRQFGWTVVLSVLMSLLVARLLTPLMASRFLKEHGKTQQDKDGFIMRQYLALVRMCLDYRKTTILASLLFLGASVLLALQLPTGFIPPSDQGYTNFRIELPPGSNLLETRQTAEEVRRSVEAIPGIKDIFVIIGSAGGDDGEEAGNVRTGSMVLTFLPKADRPPQSDIDRQIRQMLKDIPGARFTLSNDGPGEKFQILLSSENPVALANTARAIEREIRGIGLLSNVSSTVSLQNPEIDIRPDLVRAAALGVETRDLADTIRIATVGDYSHALSKLNLDGRQLPIRAQLTDTDLQDFRTLEALHIPTASGQTALSNIASITRNTGPAQIDRYDRQRYVTISADLGGASLGEALKQAMALPSVQSMPSNVTLFETGEAETMGELFSGFGIAMLAGVFCVFCVLVLLFKDLLQPITILSALPLSFGGSVVALIVTGGEISLTALVGIIMLMGIVSKNSILLVEYTIMSMSEKGMATKDALLDACHKRARPIVMTTVAMIAGMMPIALGIGGDSFRQPMAISVIGGLLSSTALSLLVVPVVFTYMHSLSNHAARLFDRSAQGDTEKAEAA
ncbi:efflux RND transporter permease subunit [uncultured Cohaesibacter sp.]|uniref:efflux RND transporter permease subunit n=1 Tax=uncultured Cohaesibacter sp. TaxID=1002546 RepID=UPI0029C6D3F0|nr:efflux RND transporter permease subunit [uncultured Cohaesibacter sp.]